MNPQTDREQMKADLQLRNAEEALGLLLRARECLKRSDNRQTLKRVRLAISSAKGAVRICRNRTVRAFHTDRRNNGEIE